jgi:N-terminal domain of molybdenum-binding protein
MKISAKIFLEDNHSYVLGPGRLALLKATGELGSLHKAAQAMGMSYRWAWGRIRDSEKALGVPLLTQEGDGGRGKPKVLSAEALELLDWYAELELLIDGALAVGADRRPEFLKLGAQAAPARADKRKTTLD